MEEPVLPTNERDQGYDDSRNQRDKNSPRSIKLADGATHSV